MVHFNSFASYILQGGNVKKKLPLEFIKDYLEGAEKNSRIILKQFLLRNC